MEEETAYGVKGVDLTLGVNLEQNLGVLNLEQSSQLESPKGKAVNSESASW